MKALIVLIAFTLGAIMFSNAGSKKDATSVHEFTMKSIDGTEIPLANYKGKVLLIVNVASECGFTPQYKALQDLFQKYKDKGFVVLGFPANNFGGQEPGTDAEIKTFCTTKYNVTFDMFSKISVKGSDQHPLYTWLTSGGGNQKLSGDVKWNFGKFLVDKNGRLTQRWGSGTEPLSDEIGTAITAALK